jgi:hypothetical protein
MHAQANATIFTIFAPYSTPIDQSHDAQIALAIADIGDQIAPNYAEYARKYELDRSTLSRRHRGKRTSRKEATSDH